MRVLILSNGADNGGVGIAIKKAFNKYATDWVVHSVTRADNFIGFDKDVFWPPNANNALITELWKSADVIHMMDKFESATTVPNYDEVKPRLIHHHGSIFRSNPYNFIERCQKEGIPQLAATFDLLKYDDSVQWMPHPIDINYMQHFISPYRKGLIHTPGAGYNGTDHLKKAIQGTGWELDIVTNLPWNMAMKRKGMASVLFDSMDIGYGMTSVEAYALRMPVIAGGSSATESKIFDTMGYLPYLSATPESLRDVLVQLQEPQLQKEVESFGWQCVNDYHAEQKVVERLKLVYEKTVEEWTLRS